MESNLDDFLTHYGVKGMKWGIRKKPSKRLVRKAEKIRERREKLAESSVKTRLDQEKKLNQQQTLRILLMVGQHLARRRVNDINLDYAAKHKVPEMMEAMGGMPINDIPTIRTATAYNGVYDITSLGR